MKYVALLRGINVGGNNKINMDELQRMCESLHFQDVSTYINSGNLFFRTNADQTTLASRIESTINKTFSLNIPVVVRSKTEIQTVDDALPSSWQNNTETKCDALFLWDEVDDESVIAELAPVRGIDEMHYVPGALLWRIQRDSYNQSAVKKFFGTKIYKKMTARNCNTLRKINQRLSD